MKQKGKMSGKKLKQMFVTYTFVLPDFIGLLVFIIIPIIYSFYMSLYDWKCNACMPSGILDITSSAKSPAEQYKNVWHQIGGKTCENQRKLWKQAV